MKAKILLSLILVFFLCNSVYSQEILMNCVSSAPPPGNVLPSIGTVNVLVVFAQFPDDNYDINNPLWVKGQAPANMNNWINQTWTASPTQGSLTHYFNDMSWNSSTNTARFKFIGKTVSAIAPHTRQWYLDNNTYGKRWHIQKEILQTLDVGQDFLEFDNWDASRNNISDGKVDMIIFIWRNIAREFDEAEKKDIESKLNFDNNYGSLGFEYTPGYFTVDGGVRKIYANDWGSGVSIRNYVANGYSETFRLVVHEIAHYLIGHNDYHNGLGFWGMLSAWGYRSVVANSFERRMLGWINPTVIPSSPTQTISNVQLKDYITTGDVIAMEISSNECFYIENHQGISYWETTFASGTIEPGIFVIRRVGGPSWTSSSWLQLIAADGRFDWQVNQSVTNPWGSNPALLPVFKQLTANIASGYHDDHEIPFSYGGLLSPAPIHFTENPTTGQPQVDVRFRGDGKDAFRISYNQVFSPWSNPNNQKAANSTTPFGFEITSLSNGIYTLNLYVNTSADASPSKPQNLHLTYANQYHPSLGWDVNTEPDISSYKIYRNYDNGGWAWAGTVTHPTNTFIDNLVDYTKPIWEKPVKYYVVAVDNTSKTSVSSEQVETSGIMPLAKMNDENYAEEKAAEEIVHDFKLYDNYPDPFNPATTIRYQIPEAGMVTLKVYDILGREVAELVNETKSAGYYEVNFDASKLTA